MIHGLDTGFLVAFEMEGHPDHAAAKTLLAQRIKAGDQLALAPQVLAEFLHVVTDPHRFEKPLEMRDALPLAW